MILFLPFEVKALKAVFLRLFDFAPNSSSTPRAYDPTAWAVFLFDDINDKTANCSGLDISIS